jgi:hypothetical protein
MTTSSKLRALALATATLAFAAVLSPAGAETKAAPQRFTAPTQALLGACDRTVGCSYTTTGSVTTGCSPTVCFVCNEKSCAPLVARQHPVGHLPVGQTNSGSASTAPVRAVAAVNNGAGRPVAVERSTAHSSQKP